VLKIDTCNANDLPRILALANLVWKPTFSPILSEDRLNYLFEFMYSRDRLCQQLGSPNHSFFILQDDNSDVGYAQLVFEQESVKLEKLYLHQNAQGKGYGLYLLNQLIDHAMNLGSVEMQLQVNRANTKAVEFYKKFGFEIIEERDFEVGGGHVMDDYVMSINLQNR
jgi:diamine N-acetyltransferase